MILGYYNWVWPKMYVFLRNLIFPFSKILPYFPKSGLIYDVGSGYGSYALSLALGSRDRQVIGLELNEDRVKEANRVARTVPNLHFEVRDLRKDSSLQSCDCISLIDILHHVPLETQSEIIKECFSILNKNGLLIIKDIAETPRWKYLVNYAHDRFLMRNKSLFFRKTSEFRQMCIDAGFKVKIKRINTLLPYPHVLILCHKE